MAPRQFRQFDNLHNLKSRRREEQAAMAAAAARVFSGGRFVRECLSAAAAAFMVFLPSLFRRVFPAAVTALLAPTAAKRFYAA